MANNVYLRRAGLALLSADAGLAAIVGARVYPPQRPPNVVWPFVAWGVAIETPFEAACMAGSEIRFAVHCYAETTGTGGATVSGEERAADLAARVKSVLLEAGELDLQPHGAPGPTVAHIFWEQTQVVQDAARGDAFHAIVQFRAIVVR